MAIRFDFFDAEPTHSLSDISRLSGVLCNTCECIRSVETRDISTLNGLPSLEFIFQVPGNHDVRWQEFSDAILEIPGEIQSVMEHHVKAGIVGGSPAIPQTPEIFEAWRRCSIEFSVK